MHDFGVSCLLTINPCPSVDPTALSMQPLPRSPTLNPKPTEPHPTPTPCPQLMFSATFNDRVKNFAMRIAPRANHVRPLSRGDRVARRACCCFPAATPCAWPTPGTSCHLLPHFLTPATWFRHRLQHRTCRRHCKSGRRLTHMRLHAHAFTHTHVYTRMRLLMHTFTHARVYSRTRLHTRTFTHAHGYTRACTTTRCLCPRRISA